MPEMGRPRSANANPFGNIKMANKVQKSNRRAQNVGSELNELAGNGQIGGANDVKYVDRKDHNTMGKDGFLKLLTHQLTNQDPLKPMDQKEFAAELAQFSQLEQMTDMNKKLESLTNKGPSEDKFYGASFLGKEIITKGTSLNYAGDLSKSDIPFFLPKNAKNAIVRIFDEKKQMVAQINLEDLPKGSQSATWDGRKLDGTSAGKGAYTISVNAWDENLQQFQGETRSKGKVTSVRFDNGETIFEVDGKKQVYLRDVDSFRLPRHNTNNAPKPNPQAASKAYNKNLQ